MTRITIDPITRIEGHLRIDCEVDNGKVVNAWSSGQMWRGIEVILGAAVQEFFDEFGELAFPEDVLEATARFGEAQGQATQFSGVGGDALARGKTVAFHGGPRVKNNPLL